MAGGIEFDQVGFGSKRAVAQDPAPVCNATGLEHRRGTRILIPRRQGPDNLAIHPS